MKSGQLEQQGAGERSGSQRKWLLKVRNMEKRDMNIREWNGRIIPGPPQIFLNSSVQFSRSVVSDSLRPMNHSTPGLPVHHQLLESTQTHAHCVGDAIQPSHPLSSPSLCPQSFPASGSFQMSQLFTLGGQSIGVSASTSVDVNWSSSICVHSNYFFIIHFIWFVVYFLGRYST